LGVGVGSGGGGGVGRLASSLRCHFVNIATLYQSLHKRWHKTPSDPPPDDITRPFHPQVVKQCVGTEGVEPDYIRTEVLPEFFRCFWQRRMALDRRNYRALVETTVEIANKVRARAMGDGGGGALVLGRWKE